MAYRIDAGQPVPDEVRRVLGEQLRKAARELARSEQTDGSDGSDGSAGPDDEPVHQARKHVKKARSLLRLARDDFGPGVVRHAQGELRSAAERLSVQRDLDAQVEVAAHLVARTEQGTERRIVVETVRIILAGEAARARASGALTWGAARTVARQLEHTAEWLERLPARTEGWDAIGPGLRRQYARGRRIQRTLPDEPANEALHEWRKRVKDLWYHERLLRRLWRDAQRPIVSAASDLADHLGTDHDLGLLEARLRGDLGERADGSPDPVAELAPEMRHVVLDLVVEERARLQHEARRLGARLYADDPDAWVGRHRSWWKVATREAEAEADVEAGEDVDEPGEADGGAAT